MKNRGTMSAWAKRLAALTAGATLLVSGGAFAAAPATSLIEGVMTSSGGGAAADGTYDVTFSLWEAQSGGSAIWSEGPVKVAVKGGQFSYALGTSKALDIKKVAALKGQWLSLKIGSDPELPRQKVHSSLFSLWADTAGSLTCTGCITSNHIANGSMPGSKMGFAYAASATKGGPASDLACTGCVSVKEMKFDADINLGKQSLAAATVTANTFIGDGSKLTGIKIPSGTCSKAGEVVKGINADGTLKCVKAMDPTALPADGIDEISNGLISNQFTDEIVATGSKVLIPDNQGIDAVWNLSFPNIGKAQAIDIHVKVENTDLSKVAITLLPPDDKKTGWTLCDPCGKPDAKKYDKVFNPANPPQKQAGTGKKIADWIGQNPTGLWTLKVTDTDFCVPQKPGNSVYCNTSTKKDGWISFFSIKLKTLSNGKIAQNGDLYVAGKIWGKDNGYGKAGGTLDVGGAIKVGTSTTTCATGTKGAMRYNTTYNAMEFCDGILWQMVSKPAKYRWTVFDTYGNGNMGWVMGNNAAMFGGVNPSSWTDGNYSAKNLSSNTDYLLTLFNRKGYPGNNAMVYSSVFTQYSSTTGRVAMVLFRIRNTTSKPITWTPYWYRSSYSGWNEYTSVGINGADVWKGNCQSGTCNQSLNISIPANRTSTVVFISMSSYPYYRSSYGYIRATQLGFYNNCLKLPAGLRFVDDLDTKPNGWNN